MTHTTRALATSATVPALLGDETLETNVDSNAAGLPEAFPFQSSVAGAAASIVVYIDSRSKATQIIAGLYSNRNGHPGALVDAGTLGAPRAGAWDTVTLPAKTLTAGTYWLALLGKGGTVYFRDRLNGPCRSENTSSGGFSALPSTWKSGPAWKTCPISAYVPEPPASPPPPPVTLPPVNTSAPTISGTARDGSTLTASAGSWANSPTLYAYQWQRCSTGTPGLLCTDISGATASTHTLTKQDVGSTVRVIVTGANSAGSTPASSAQTAVVTLPPPPSNTALPLLSGSAGPGSTLTTSNGSWSNNPTGYAYAWEDCDSSGANCTTISNASASSYTLTSADVGHTIRSVVTASNDGGSSAASSAQTAPVSLAAPSNTARPSVSGSAVQGQTLSTSNGSWSGNPTGYSYAWEQCDSSGAKCAAIANATASSYILASGDVGHTIRAVVTATNAGGAASASSAATAVVTAASSGTPNPGNGVSTDPAFFPIGVWDQTATTNAQNYANIGVNAFVGQFNGNSSSALQALKNAGLILISQQDSTGLNDPNNGVIKAWQSLPDEPDNAQPNGSGGYGPCVAPSTIVSDYHQLKAADPTRPVYLNFGQGIANTSWSGRGSCSGNTAMYPQYAQGADIVSFDVYPVNEGYPLSILATGVDNLRSWAGNKPLYAFIETTAFNGGTAPTPAQIRSETWLALIHGANGIEYFCHIFSPTFHEAGCLTLPAVVAQLKSDDAQITSLAPELNSNTLPQGVAVTSSMRVDTMVKSYGGSTYVFSEAVDSNGGAASFKLPSASNGPVTVLGENRTLTMSGGTFTDNFAGYGVHIYQIPGS